MAALTGASTLVALKKAGTFGTAVTVGAGDKYECESFDPNENVEELRSNPIGSGLDMDNSSERGATAPNISIDDLARYDHPGNVADAILFGAASVNAAGGGYYAHSFLYEATRNQAFATVAAKLTTNSILEYASCTPTKITETLEGFPNYIKRSIELLGNQMKVTGQTNTTTNLGNTTVTDAKRVVATTADYFMINAQGGAALSSGDKRDIVKATVEFSVEAEFVKEMRGAAGNGMPRVTGEPPFTAMLTVEFRNLPDFDFFVGALNDQEYKAAIEITSGSYLYGIYFPRLKIVEEVDYSVASANENSYTVKFKSLVATSAPTGMISGYPYKRIKNQKSTGYLA